MNWCTSVASLTMWAMRDIRAPTQNLGFAGILKGIRFQLCLWEHSMDCQCLGNCESVIHSLLTCLDFCYVDGLMLWHLTLDDNVGICQEIKSQRCQTAYLKPFLHLVNCKLELCMSLQFLLFLTWLVWKQVFKWKWNCCTVSRRLQGSPEPFHAVSPPARPNYKALIVLTYF